MLQNALWPRNLPQATLLPFLWQWKWCWWLFLWVSKLWAVVVDLLVITADLYVTGIRCLGKNGCFGKQTMKYTLLKSSLPKPHPPQAPSTKTPVISKPSSDNRNFSPCSFFLTGLVSFSSSVPSLSNLSSSYLLFPNHAQFLCKAFLFCFLLLMPWLASVLRSHILT